MVNTPKEALEFSYKNDTLTAAFLAKVMKTP